MDLIEDIGPILGIVAFLGFAVLALLIVLQAREVRRLREWAGRAPERALEADEAALAAGEEAHSEAEAEDEGPSRLAAAWAGTRDALGRWWHQVDRRSPVDPRWFVALLFAGVVAAGVVTGGFGLGGSDEPTPRERRAAAREAKPEPVEVAVLNATQQEGIADPVPGVASLVAEEVVRPAGFKPGAEGDALAGEEDSVIMFEPDAEADAEELAAAVADSLGETEVIPITQAARDQADSAPVVLLVGFADSELAADGAAETATP